MIVSQPSSLERGGEGKSCRVALQVTLLHRGSQGSKRCRVLSEVPQPRHVARTRTRPAWPADPKSSLSLLRLSAVLVTYRYGGHCHLRRPTPSYHCHSARFGQGLYLAILS